MWAVGCIFGELLALKPIFKGEEVKMDNKKTVPFQRGQMQKIIEILGTPTRKVPLLSNPPHISLNTLALAISFPRSSSSLLTFGFRRQMAIPFPAPRIHPPNLLQTIHQRPQKMVPGQQRRIPPGPGPSLQALRIRPQQTNHGHGRSTTRLLL